jgi:hypothetical protein
MSSYNTWASLLPARDQSSSAPSSIFENFLNGAAKGLVNSTFGTGYEFLNPEERNSFNFSFPNTTLKERLDDYKTQIESLGLPPEKQQELLSQAVSTFTTKQMESDDSTFKYGILGEILKANERQVQATQANNARAFRERAPLQYGLEGMKITGNILANAVANNKTILPPIVTAPGSSVIAPGSTNV